MLFFLSTVVLGGGEQTNIGIGLKVGLNRMEGDLNNPLFKPGAFGFLKYNLFEYLAIGFESGYSITGSNKDDEAGLPESQTIIVPFEGQLVFSFFPLGKINPYVVLGGGGFYWNYTEDNTTPFHWYEIDENGKAVIKYGENHRKGYDSFFKSGGGIEILLNKNHNFYFDLGFTFRYSLTDMLDNVNHGDEKDGLIDIHGGFTYYFRTSKRGDRDNDGVPDELDLKIDIKEDADDYMDHDGKPDGIAPVPSSSDNRESDISVEDNKPPVVMHTPVRRIEAGQNVNIMCDIYENMKLKTASILYRPIGFNGWKVGALRIKSGPTYEGVIPGRFVKKQGLEYCVIAVDEAISGVGYCGLPKLPVRVEVLSHPKTWRIVSSVVALLGWGGSGYLILRNQR